MATVVLQYAGQALGTAIGGPLGGMIGRAAGAVAGNIIDQSLFGPGARKAEGPRLNDLRVMSSSEGAAVPRLWGRMRVSGQVIWATAFEEVAETHTEKASAKGGRGSSTKITEYNYFANFAVGLCEGVVDRVGRVWANGKEIDISEFTVRLHRGGEDQEADSLIVAKEGAGNAPAYRGLAYVVFERLPVNAFGNRLPQLSFEVFRNAGGAGEAVKAVNIIPGSTEFGYDVNVVTRHLGGGVTESENAHASALRSDWTVSLDDLQAACPNAGAASLVVAWFTGDLRCAEAQIRPGIENVSKVTEPDLWSAGGVSRAAAHVVSQSEGGPAYGGTPSDASVLRAIADLRARGLATVFYPFLLMDIPDGNGLPDPWGGAEQGAYPWRGRITCSIAPGRPGSPDKSAAVAAEVAQFMGNAQAADFSVNGTSVAYSGPAGWGYRRMILHYAHLCAAAGGVDAFLIGSELRGLTTLRAAGNSYPFVTALAALAADVKSILPAAKVSYAADWSEYFGHQPADGSGDVFFHLDPLWASSAVDFVGIDNYMPVTDWRDGPEHLDRLAGVLSPYGEDYIKSNIAGGEGFDWFYADDEGRLKQARLPIADGAYGKPWVFRCKDVKSWWLNAHHDRPGGVESALPTAWVPQSKPVWFTEAGCPAIDKGGNQPNAFADAKSSESLLPYFSNGQRDDLMQNRYVTAVSAYWEEAGPHNPVSAVYGGRMVDPARLFFWAWDARPYPYFPARTDIWADGVNYARGHGLNGRIGAVPLAALISDVCASFGVTDADVQDVEGLIDGFTIDRPMPARDALEGLLASFGIDAIESGGRLKFRMRSKSPSISLALDGLVEPSPDSALFAITRAQETELPSALKLAYIESGIDYRRSVVESQRLAGASNRDVFIELPCAIGQGPAQIRADIGLRESWVGRDRIEAGLGRGALRLEPGDVVQLALPAGARQFRIDEVSDGGFRKLRGRSFQQTVYEPPDAITRGITAAAVRVFGRPDAVMMDLPLSAGLAVAHAPWIAASAKPWPGQLAVYRETGTGTYAFNRTVDNQATKGRLTEALPAGPLHVFDRSNSITVKLENGALSSVSEIELLGGANAAAVGDPGGGWEIIQFADAELIAADTYRLTRLLRGQSGSEPEMAGSRPAGARFILLNAAAVQPQFALSDARQALAWRIGPSQYDPNRSYMALEHHGKMLGLRPLAPCHLRAAADGGDAVFTWIRRTRGDGDNWELEEVPLGEETESYRVDVMDGAAVKRSADVNAPSYRYSAASIAADFGAMPTVFTLRIGQISAVYGRGANLERTIHV